MRRQRRIERCERVSRTLPCPMASGIFRMPSAWIGEVRDEDARPALADLGLARIGPRFYRRVQGPGANRVDLGSRAPLFRDTRLVEDMLESLNRTGDIVSRGCVCFRKPKSLRRHRAIDHALVKDEIAKFRRAHGPRQHAALADDSNRLKSAIACHPAHSSPINSSMSCLSP